MGAWKGIYMGLQAVKADKEAKKSKALEAEKLEMLGLMTRQEKLCVQH